KTVEHNLELIDRLDEIVAIGRPVVFGASRKSFLGKLTGRQVDERLAGTIASNMIAYERGARVFRVHDVAPAVDALKLATATVRRRGPTGVIWSRTSRTRTTSTTTMTTSRQSRS